jgi:hypothetical protein
MIKMKNMKITEEKIATTEMSKRMITMLESDADYIILQALDHNVSVEEYLNELRDVVVSKVEMLSNGMKAKPKIQTQAVSSSVEEPVYADGVETEDIEDRLSDVKDFGEDFPKNPMKDIILLKDNSLLNTIMDFLTEYNKPSKAKPVNELEPSLFDPTEFNPYETPKIVPFECEPMTDAEYADMWLERERVFRKTWRTPDYRYLKRRRQRSGVEQILIEPAHQQRETAYTELRIPLLAG